MSPAFHSTTVAHLFISQNRVSTYTAMDPSKLDEDQKRAVSTLPTLETIQKELGEVKKVIEVRSTLCGDRKRF